MSDEAGRYFEPFQFEELISKLFCSHAGTIVTPTMYSIVSIVSPKRVTLLSY